LLALAGSAAVLASQPASAITTVIGFDNIPEGTVATNQFTGVVFSGASVLTENSELNPAFPPKSDPNVVYDYLNGTITLDFTVPVSEIGAYVTGNFSITESIYDGATLLGTIATGGPTPPGPAPVLTRIFSSTCRQWKTSPALSSPITRAEPRTRSPSTT
jgi:hypothetical protein